MSASSSDEKHLDEFLAQLGGMPPDIQAQLHEAMRRRWATPPAEAASIACGRPLTPDQARIHLSGCAAPRVANVAHPTCRSRPPDSPTRIGPS